MKVSGVGPTTSTDRTRRSQRSDGAGKGEFARVLGESVEAPVEPPAAETASAVSGIDALLAVQAAAAPDDREARQRLIRRGEDLLERLEEIRHGLLVGTLSKERLVELARMVRSRREAVADPRLGAIMDEIELRAEVELAKLSRRAD